MLQPLFAFHHPFALVTYSFPLPSRPTQKVKANENCLFIDVCSRLTRESFFSALSSLKRLSLDLFFSNIDSEFLFFRCEDNETDYSIHFNPQTTIVGG